MPKAPHSRCKHLHQARQHRCEATAQLLQLGQDIDNLLTLYAFAAAPWANSTVTAYSTSAAALRAQQNGRAATRWGAAWVHCKCKGRRYSGSLV